MWGSKKLGTKSIHRWSVNIIFATSASASRRVPCHHQSRNGRADAPTPMNPRLYTPAARM
jgi:hypothetical protein